MIGFKAVRSTPTPSDLNGPILSFSQDATSFTTCGVATFIGIATATFASGSAVNNPAVGLGTIAYQWYQVGEGALSDSSTISGTASTTLILTSPTSRSIFYLEATYVPNGTTAKAINQPLNSTTVTATVPPDITFLTQPSDVVTITNDPATFNVVAGTSDSSTVIFGYQWSLNGEEVADGDVTDTNTGIARTTTISGATTPTLTLTSTEVGIQTVNCTVSSSGLCNSPVGSNDAQVNVVSPIDATRALLNYEIVREDNTTLYDTGEQNLVDNSISFTSSTENPSRVITIYSQEKDIPVTFTLKGGAGLSFGSNLGGEGGVTTFEYTLKRNTEYLLKLSPSQDPFGGKGGGGGAAFLYEKAVLLAVCGGGGGASSGGNGGNGGGLGVAGQSGFGRNSGSGGELVENGTLPTSGSNSSGTTGGRTSACTPGDYFKNLGYAPCADIGEDIPWRSNNGDPIVGSAVLSRGFKSGGTPYRNNGGDSSILDGNTFVGGGGSGAIGGDATASSDSTGGGGSGYTNGAVTISTTSLGGNTSTESSVTISAAV